VSESRFGVGIVDTMIGFQTDPAQLYAAMRKSFRDRESREDFVMPAEYMFRDAPVHDFDPAADAVALTLAEMDLHGVEVGLISVSAGEDIAARALRDHPRRFVPSWTCDPNEGMEGIRKLVRAYEHWGCGPHPSSPTGPRPTSLSTPR